MPSVPPEPEPPTRSARFPESALDPESPWRSRGSVWRIEQAYWLSIGYMAVWTIGQIVFAHSVQERMPLFGFFGVLLLAALVLVGRVRHALHRGGYGQGYTGRQSILFPIAHLILIVIGVRLTGAAQSPFWLVFFLALVAETVLATPGESRWMRAGAGFGLLASTFPIPFEIAFVPEFLTRLLFLILVSIIAGRLRQYHSAREMEIASLRSEMASVDERSRLSREIHDQVGNTLASSVLRLEVAARQVERESGDGVQASLLREEATGLRDAMNKVRDWTFLTRPWTATEVDSPATVLEREAARMARRCGIPATVTDAQMLDLLSPPSRLAALRIAQEALANVVKHARTAQTVSVVLWRDRDDICLRISDDGAGFDVERSSDSIGLTSMRERASGVGGCVTVVSERGSGTTVTARLPLPN